MAFSLAPAGAINILTRHPIQIGSHLIIWCTGLGAVDSDIPDGANTGGAIVNTLVTPAVLIGGVPTTLVYSVLSPQYAGEYQVAVQVPPGTPTGNAVPLQIQMNGKNPGILLAIMTAAYDNSNGKVSLGCVAAEMTCIDPPMFAYNSQAQVQVDAFLTSPDSEDAGPGSCTRPTRQRA